MLWLCADLQAALQEDAHLQHALPQRLLIPHGGPPRALLGRAVPPVCQRRLVLSPQGFDFPLKGTCLPIILSPCSNAWDLRRECRVAMLGKARGYDLQEVPSCSCLICARSTVGNT